MGIGQTRFVIPLITIFIAVFMLFYIFDSLHKLAERCEAGENLAVCGLMTGLSLSMLIILLIIGGFIFIISMTVFILIT